MTIYVATYQQILDAEQAIGFGRELYDFRQAINAILANAEDNAQDDAGRLASIESLLCFPAEYNTPEVRAWFAALGITP